MQKQIRKSSCFLLSQSLEIYKNTKYCKIMSLLSAVLYFGKYGIFHKIGLLIC